MLLVCCYVVVEGQKWGLKTVKNGPRVWAFCKIEFSGIQKPVQILAQKSAFFKKCGNRGVGVIWLVLWGVLAGVYWLGVYLLLLWWFGWFVGLLLGLMVWWGSVVCCLVCSWFGRCGF